MIRYYTHLKTSDKPQDFYQEVITSIGEREKLLLLEANDYTELYYELGDIIAEYTKYYDLMHKKSDELLNFFGRNNPTNSNEEEKPKLTEKEIDELLIEMDSRLDDLIVLLNMMLLQRREISKYMRTQLSSYDVL